MSTLFLLPKPPSSFNNGVLFRPLPHLLQRLGLSQDLISLLLDSEESYLAALVASHVSQSIAK